MRKLIAIALIFFVGISVLSSVQVKAQGPVAPTPTFVPPGVHTSTSVSVGSKGVLMGYYTNWSIYGAQYFPKGIVTSGSGAKMTHLNYAFGNVDASGHCVVIDPWSEYQKSYPAAQTVAGVDQPGYNWGLPDGISPARGLFYELQQIKALYPNLKVLYSFGGWNDSANFGVAAASPAAAAAFADSCYTLLHQPGWAGLFDGIDIDWEYPNACGNTCDTSGQNGIVTLLSALRNRFGSELVTEAVPAGTNNINAANYGAASQYVNWFNVMTYDYFGAWAATGPTAPHSPLFPWPGMPTTLGQGAFYIDSTINQYLAKGVPANKMVMGFGFYGRGWKGVPNINGGLNQTATGPADDPSGLYGANAGVAEYHALVSACPATRIVAGTAEAYCNGNWWSYDIPVTIAFKMIYKKFRGLGGAYFWDLSGDTSDGSLVSSMYTFR